MLVLCVCVPHRRGWTDHGKALDPLRGLLLCWTTICGLARVPFMWPVSPGPVCTPDSLHLQQGCHVHVWFPDVPLTIASCQHRTDVTDSLSNHLAGVPVASFPMSLQVMQRCHLVAAKMTVNSLDMVQVVGCRLPELLRAVISVICFKHNAAHADTTAPTRCGELAWLALLP